MKPAIVEKIERLWGKRFELHPAPVYPNDPLAGLMAFKTGHPKYAVEEDRLIGLNLADTGLDDGRWEEIVKILGSKVKHLQALNLNKNKLKSLVLPEGMPDLQILDLSENQLAAFSLPEDIIGLKELFLEENPLTAPPPEVVEQGSKAVLAWFASFRKDTVKQEHFLREIKILLVGEGLAGKTSVLKRIKGLPFDEHESQTHGVNVETLEMGTLPLFSSFESMKDVKVRLWDFGGQEIMHASHQFFLTHRSIYVFVLDSRTDNKKDYWLRHIQKFGGGSPAVVAINKMDENKSYSLEESTLNSKYSFVGNRFVKMSCKTGLGLQQFAKTLAELIPETPLLKTPISESWLNIKDQLEQETFEKRYINRRRFQQICEQYKEDDPTAQNALLRYLNSLGVVLHFPGLSLQEFYVLDPHWVTIGVYRIINSPSITEGILKEKNLDFILNHEDQKREEYDPSREKAILYSNAEQAYIVGIMKEFELLYEYNKGSYLVPDLLPKELSKPVSFDRVSSVAFIIEYDFLPPNIIARFIIHMKEDVHDLSNLWRTGAVLSNKSYGCTALVTADMERQRISIWVNGEKHRKREYFSIIRHRLCAINDDFAGLKVTEKMPVPGHPDIEWDYEELLGLERMGEDKLTIGRLGKAFSVSRDFLDKISTKEERQYAQGPEKLGITIRIDDRHTKEQLSRIERSTADTEKNTLAILSNQALHQKYLDSLLVYAGSHQEKIQQIFARIDADKDTGGDFTRIDGFLEAQLDKFFAQLPTAAEIVQKWKEANAKPPDSLDARWKLKFKIPFLFGEFEKELAWDAKAILRSIRKEWAEYLKGERTLRQLFVEEE